MKSAWILARGRLDYWRLLMRHHWAYLVSFLSLVVALLSLLAESIAIVAGAVAAALGAALFWRDNRALIEERQDIAETQLDSDVFGDIVVPREMGAARHLRWNDATVLIFGDIGATFDARLRTLPFTYVEDRAPLMPEFREVAPFVLRGLFQAGKAIFDGPILGLASDITPPADKEPEPVLLRRVGYFDGLCTNELGSSVLRSRRQRRVVLDGPRLVMDSEGRLRPLADSWCANGIGISTVAFTTDGRLLVVTQSRRNVPSGNRLAPSGSGSAEPKDLAGASSLGDVVIAAMEREMREECGLRDEIDVETRVLGWGRWLERGARPEFFGVSRLACSSDQLRILPAERLYVAEQRGLRVGAVDVTGLLDKHDRSHLGERAGFSMPLYVCLELLRHALADQPDLADWLGAAAARRGA